MNTKFNIEDACILVVDDEMANLKLVKDVLAVSGYTNVITTDASLEVVDIITNINIDLILLDLNMPVLDGFGVMQALKELSDIKVPPILVLTAQDMQSYRQRALDMGARDYVTKPFNVKELLSRVHNLVEAQMAYNFMNDQNIILEETVKQRTKAIHDTRLQVVRCLGRAAEYRDNETGFHIIRMSKIAVLIASATGMDSHQCDLLLNAAPMHDIGKIGIPDDILLKPGKFKPHEWEIMKTHVQIGADILSGDDSDLMRMAHDIALTHHEKWDGSGYPNAQKQEDIPLVGRITALADVFDALTSERPYKKAWSISKAVELIKAEAGKHFDPSLVEIFLKKLPAITAVSEEYAEPDESLFNVDSK